MDADEIVYLNVGGRQFCTSRETLTWVPDSFFSSLLSGRIPTTRDKDGAIFIDRDPGLFSVILNYLRTKDLDLKHVDSSALRNEAEYYGVTPLFNRLCLCDELSSQSCGGALFHGYIPAPCGPQLAAAPGPAAARAHPVNAEPSAIQAAPYSAWCGRNLGQRGGQVKTDVAMVHVTHLQGHYNLIAAAYSYFVCIYRIRERTSWHCVWTSPVTDQTIEHLAINARSIMGGSQEMFQQHHQQQRMVAVSYQSVVRLWCINGDSGEGVDIGTFNLTVHVDELLYIGSQLVALGHCGKVGVWHAMSQHWQVQDVQPITSHDVTGSTLLLGCSNGSIAYIDMQKFPLRMKDNDLLVTELYRDSSGHAVTALSVYATPKMGMGINWVELAYGTSGGAVKIIIQHPETVGQGPQLLQNFTVHRNPVTRVQLTEKFLISVCSDYNHVRTWSVTRFRGMISTQPGPTPKASFKVLTLDGTEGGIRQHAASVTMAMILAKSCIGPYGDTSEEQPLFVQKVVPETNQLYVRLASTGTNLCVVRSCDASSVTCFCVHECEGSNRMGSRPRRYLFTGHSNGSIQIWDLTAASELSKKEALAAAAATGSASVPQTPVNHVGGPSATDLVGLLEQWDLSQSRTATPSSTPSPSLPRNQGQRERQRLRDRSDDAAGAGGC